MGILLFNQSGSIEADRAYQETIQDKDNYFPSPAVFVYTLPNIVAGEIAIRNKIHGETSFFVLPQLQYTTIEDTVKGVFCNSDLKYLLTGWVEVEDDELDVRMMLCAPGDGGRINIKAATIEKIYKK
jgi:3-oxoacyl-[acyl-carrier-protein] synthase-1